MNDRGRAGRRHRWIVWDTNASLAGIGGGRWDAPRGRRRAKLASSRNFETAASNTDDDENPRERSRVSSGRDGHLGGPSRAAPLAEARGATSRIFARVFESARARS